MLKRLSVVIVTATLCVSSGCASHKSQKEAAKQQWNEARAGVLESLARDQYNAGNFDNCQKTLTDALRMTPNNPRLHVLAARLAIEQGKLEVADTELAKARKLAPKDPEADYFSGIVQQRWARPDLALGFYEAALSKNENEPSYLLAKAETLVALGRADEALTVLKERVVFFEHSAAIRDAVGQLLLAKGDVNGAIDMLRQATILSTDDLVLREHLALALYQGGKSREAGDMFDKLLKSDGYAERADLWLALGECRLAENDTRDARDAFEKAARLQPASADVYLCIAKLAMKTGEQTKAEQALRKTLSLDMASSEANLLLGYLRLEQKRYDEAYFAFKRACALAPEDTVSQCMVGLALQRMGRHDQALNTYANVLRQHPKDPLATRLLANVDVSE